MDEPTQSDLVNLYEASLASIEDEVHIWKLVKDSEGKIKTWTLVYANQKALQSWGLNLSDIRGKATEEIFVDSEPVQLFLPIVEKIFRENKTHHWQSFFKSTEQTLKMQSIPLGDYFISTGSDVSINLQTQAFIQQIHRLDSLGAIAGGVIHDINNLLAVIIGSAQMLSKTELDEKQSKLVDRLIQAGQSCGQLTRRILSFTRDEGDKIETVDINGKLEKIILLLSSNLPNDVKVEFDPHLNLPTITGCRVNFNQIFLNIGHNAIRAMKDKGGGTLVIKTDKVNVKENEIPDQMRDAKPGVFVRVSMSDSGVGMDKEVVKNLFRPFFSLNKDKNGTGLGLSIVKSLLQTHGGFVTVDSEVGKGTTFHLYFPLESTYGSQ